MESGTLLTTLSTAAAAAEDRDSLLSSLDTALEQLAELPPLDEARFLATHAIFEGLSGQRQRIIDELCARCDPPTPVDRPLRVLGVGCGSHLRDGFVLPPLGKGLPGDRDTALDLDLIQKVKF